MTNTNFTDLHLSDVLLKALEHLQFTTPTPVQAQTIPPMLERNDIIAQAQTGTGKTAAFALPILQNIDRNLHATQALILTPTRELALQVAEQFEILAKFQGTSIAVIYGGCDYGKQLQQLRQGVQVVVGTPGRILDHIERRTLKLAHISTFVLDEADEMLRMGFIEDVETVIQQLPEKKQVALFSATMPPRIKRIANNYLQDPVCVEIRAETATVKSIDQRFLFASPAQKPEALRRLLATETYQGVIVFVRTKHMSDEVATLLQQEGYKALAIHGDVSQSVRENIITQFKEGLTDILVATDVAARGLDVERVTHVINYDIPQDNETYVHRIGRTGRAGRSGSTILFVSPKESRILSGIERHTRQRIQKIQVPDNQEMYTAKLRRFIQEIDNRLSHTHLNDYQKIIEKYLEEHSEVSASSVAAAIALCANKDKPFNIESKPFVEKKEFTRERERDYGGKKEKFRDNRDKPKQHRREGENTPQELYRLEVGRVHGVKPGNIVGAIANEAGLESRYITCLQIHHDHSTVKLPQNMSKKTVQDLTKTWVCGRQLRISAVGAA